MRIIEWILVATLALTILPYFRTRFALSAPKWSLALFIATIALLHLFFEGLRWQLAFTYLLIPFVVLSVSINFRLPHWMRVCAITFGILAICLSIALGSLFPIRAIPAPNGPYSVGTFGSYLIDNTRAERFEPELQRGIEFRVWYPAELDKSRSYKTNTLFSELYTGDDDVISYLAGYLKHVKTNSYINAPISNTGPFPLILFNHGLFTTLDQNPQLVEHLASHGYVVASISHPFEGLKVSLPDRGVRTFSMDYPEDVGFSRDEVSDGGIGDRIGTIIGKNHSLLMAALYTQIDAYNASDTADERQNIVKQSIDLESLQPLGTLLTEQNLESFFKIRSRVRNRSTMEWAKDIQFMVDEFGNVDAPISDFNTQVSHDVVGVIGHSYGGSAAGEFCKIDARCAAGVNLDGTQFGENWNRPVGAPFLLVNSDTNLGGNNYAYYPPLANFFDVHIPDSEHPDYIDSLSVFPLPRLMGLSGTMPYQELTNLVNGLSLTFFDEYLKEKEEGFEKHLDSVSNRVTVLYP